VIDERGEEHAMAVPGRGYLADLDDGVVRFEDESGALVPVPLPEGERTAVPDAPEPCPACDAVAWVVAAREVCCERCGFRAGRLWSADQSPAFASIAVGPAEEAQIVEYEPLVVPAYAVPSMSTSVSRWDETDRVTVNHDVPGRLKVITSATPDADLRELLSDLLDAFPDFDDRTEAAQMIGYAHADRVLRRTVLTAPEERLELAVDGVLVPFTAIAVGDVWVARREHDGVYITIVAESFPARHVKLGALVDPADTRAGTTADGDGAPTLTRAEVIDLIDDCDLSDYRDRILAAIRPAYRIERASHGPHRLGGLPDFAPGEQWPHDERGVPHTFVAEIDASQLAPLSTEFLSPAWDHAGARLRIFVALAGRVDDFEAVVLACPPDAPLTRASEVPACPDDIDWDEDDQGDLLLEFEEQPVRLNPTLTAMIAWTAGLTDADSDDYDTFRDRLVRGGRPLGEHEAWEHMQLLGHAATHQGEDPRTYADFPDGDVNDWAVLLSFHDTEDLTYLSIAIRVEDLAAGRYDRLVVDALPY
jgi:Domain of unknown function (DUF1963)